MLPVVSVFVVSRPVWPVPAIPAVPMLPVVSVVPWPEPRP
jgi:hypothetical protein